MGNVCFNFLSLNVRGIRDLDKRKSLFTWVRNQKGDITFLQETFSMPDDFDSWKFQWPGDMYYLHNQNLLINKQSIYSKKIKAAFLKLGDLLSNGIKKVSK